MRRARGGGELRASKLLGELAEMALAWILCPRTTYVNCLGCPRCPAAGSKPHNSGGEPCSLKGDLHQLLLAATPIPSFRSHPLIKPTAATLEAGLPELAGYLDPWALCALQRSSRARRTWCGDRARSRSRRVAG